MNQDYGIRAFQRQIEALYYDRDAARGVDRTFLWFVEEVGELAKELRRQPTDRERLQEEIGDVFAWLTTLASLLEIDLADAARRYADGCPKCAQTPCAC
ncbi:MAG: nucleotide pyrophosphohydrolase [Candidatus Poribacteria bacterium]|nr:MAG: nucleotide pyrophosphohydrolase [Candidatus Poribacteria bacterium]